MPAAPEDYFGPPRLWTQVILKAKEGDGQASAAALDTILDRYYTPIVRHIQHQLRCHYDDALELAHDFLLHCRTRDFLKGVDRGKGRFRTFIKACIRNFLAEKHRTALSQKRGQGRQPASLDETDDAGRRLYDPPGEAVEAGLDLDRDWARTILSRSLAQLEQECHQALKARLFAALKGSLDAAEDQVPVAATAQELGMTEGAVKTAAHRLRGRLGELVEEEVRQTVASGDDWREELRYLLDLLTHR